MKKISVIILFAMFSLSFASAHEAEGQAAPVSAKTYSSDQQQSSSKWFIIPYLSTYYAKSDYAKRNLDDGFFGGLTVGYVKRQFGAYFAGELCLRENPKSDHVLGITMGTAWALEATKKRVVQVGLKWFICDTGYNVSFDGAINFHSDADVWIDKACIDLGYIQNMGPLSLNVACGLGRNTVQPRVGLGFNF